MRYFYKLGNLVFEIVGSGFFVDKIRDEFVSIKISEFQEPQLVYVFKDKIEKNNYRNTGRLYCKDDSILIENGFFVYSVSIGKSSTQVEIESGIKKDNSPLRKVFQRFANFNYLTLCETQVKNFVYNIFDWTSQIAGLGINQTYIHASTIEKNDNGIAFFAWGGVGKTALLSHLCMNSGFKFLSDDLGVLDSEGFIYLNPKKIQIYGYNVLNDRGLFRKVFANRGKVDFLNWFLFNKLRGPKRARRRVSPGILFEFSKKEKVTLETVFFLEKVSGSEMKISKLAYEVAARRMSSIVMSEIEPFSSLEREAEAGGFNFVASSVKVKKSIESVISRTVISNCFLVVIGESVPHHRFIEFMQGTIEDLGY